MLKVLPHSAIVNITGFGFQLKFYDIKECLENENINLTQIVCFRCC